MMYKYFVYWGFGQHLQKKTLFNISSGKCPPLAHACGRPWLRPPMPLSGWEQPLSHQWISASESDQQPDLWYRSVCEQSRDRAVEKQKLDRACRCRLIEAVWRPCCCLTGGNLVVVVSLFIAYSRMLPQNLSVWADYNAQLNRPSFVVAWL